MTSLAKRIEDLLEAHRDSVMNMQFFIVDTIAEEQNILKTVDIDSHYIILRLYEDKNKLVNLQQSQE
jgi:hypothetical protein